jgi:hypothetical protein
MRSRRSRLQTARSGFVVLAVAITTAIMPGEAAAKRPGHMAHHHRDLSVDVQSAQASLPRSVAPGTMRYYGGPKSPMWRSVE